MNAVAVRPGPMPPPPRTPQWPKASSYVTHVATPTNPAMLRSVAAPLIDPTSSEQSAPAR